MFWGSNILRVKRAFSESGFRYELATLTWDAL